MTIQGVEPIQEEFLPALIAGNRARCSQLVREQLERDPSLIALYEHVLRRSLYEVGSLWERNLISVATEHLSTALIEALLTELYERTLPNSYNGRSVVVGCIEDETHQVGIKMVADVFEMAGWESHFLGANVPNRELLRYVTEVQPDLVALSLSIYMHLAKLIELLDLIRPLAPGTPILVGGQAFLHGGTEIVERYPDTTYIPDLASLDAYLHSTPGADHGSSVPTEHRQTT